MIYCGPCKAFNGEIAGMPSQWEILLKDQQVNSMVNLKRIEWNGWEQSGPIVQLPKEYQGLVNFGPFFWLEAGRDASGKPVGIVFRGQASAESVKKWITESLAKETMFAHFKAKKRNVVPAALNHPSVTGRSASKTQEQLKTVQQPQSAPTTTKKVSTGRSHKPSSSHSSHTSHSTHSSHKEQPKASTAPSSSTNAKFKPATSSSSSGQDKRLRQMKPATFEQTSGDESSEEEQTMTKPSPHTTPGGSSSFSYNRPGTKLRLAFNSPSSADQ